MCISTCVFVKCIYNTYILHAVFYMYICMSNHRAIKRANSMLVECHKELDTFTTEHQSSVYNQPNDIEMSNADDDKKVQKLFHSVHLFSSAIGSSYF